MHQASCDPDQANVLDFWFRELTPADWFGAGERLDPLVRERFGMLHRRAAEGELDGWSAQPLGRLALILILDQFSRHIHRGTAEAFASDRRAQQLAVGGIEAGMDEQLAFAQRHFFYMPLMHAEDPALQRMSLERFGQLARLAEQLVGFARAHSGEIDRFGRFPGRNAALGRPDTSEEVEFLRQRQR